MKKFTAKNIEGTVYFPCRLSYANLFEPKGFPGQEPKYSTACLIPKEDKETLAVIKDAIKEAIERDKDKKWSGKIPKDLKLPLRDGDEDRPEDENYEGVFFLNANAQAKRPPKLLTRVKGQQATEEDLYSGAYAIAIVNFYGYNVSGNRGIGVGLVGVQKWADGERLAGSSVDEGLLDFDTDEEDFDFDDFLS